MWYEYRTALNDLDQAQKDLKELLDLQEEAWQVTQPKSLPTDKDGGRGGYSDKPGDYMVRIEALHLSERLAVAREALAAKKERVEAVLMLLKVSGLVEDRIFYLRYIDHRQPADIASMLHYSQSYVYKTLKKIEKT